MNSVNIMLAALAIPPLMMIWLVVKVERLVRKRNAALRVIRQNIYAAQLEAKP